MELGGDDVDSKPKVERGVVLRWVPSASHEARPRPTATGTQGAHGATRPPKRSTGSSNASYGHSLTITSNVHPSGFDQLLPATLATAAVDPAVAPRPPRRNQRRFLPTRRSHHRQGGDTTPLILPGSPSDRPSRTHLSAHPELWCPPAGGPTGHPPGAPASLDKSPPSCSVAPAPSAGALLAAVTMARPPRRVPRAVHRSVPSRRPDAV